MFSRMGEDSRTTAAWRISIWTTLAFALGTAAAFAVVYFLVAQGIRERIDNWLSGEVVVLAQVSAETPSDHLHQQMVEELAELAAHEVPDERDARGEGLSPVFFLVTDPNNTEGPLWVGPGPKDAFVAAIQRAQLGPGAPKSIAVEGWQQAFRVVVHAQNGKDVYLGLSDRGTQHTLQNLARRLLMVWDGIVLFGFAVSYWSARRTLSRIERITDTVARFAEPVNADEISRLAKTFNHMLDRLQASVNQLHTLTGAIAHDLKSPVTLIRGTLESALCRQENDTLRASVGEAIEELDKLLQLLNTALDIAEAEAGALRIDRGPVDFSAVVGQLLHIYQRAMAERQHEIISDIESPVVVDADLALLNRAVSNLLENELTHLPAGCQVSVRLRSHQGSAELVIQDNGPGFPPDIGSRAFERFVKGKHSPGHGLGLAFVEAVVHAHGGAARISDRAQGGAVITLSLPVTLLQPA